MIKRAMISGLNAAGLDVADLRVSPPAVSRHVLKTQGFAAAVHVGLSQLDPEAVFIRIYEPPGHPAHAGPADGDREELHAPGAAARRRRGRRLGLVPGARAGELRPGPARLDRRGHRPRAPLPDRRRLRLLGLVVRAAARGRPDGGRGDLGARLLRRGDGGPRDARAGGRPHEAPRHRDRRRPRRRLRPVRRAALPRRRAGPRGSGRPDAAAVRAPARPARDPRQGRLPEHGHEQGRRARRRRARDHPHAELAQRPDAARPPSRASSSREPSAAATSSRTSCRPTTPWRASPSCSSCSRRSAGRSRSWSRSCPSRP